MRVARRRRPVRERRWRSTRAHRAGRSAAALDAQARRAPPRAASDAVARQLSTRDVMSRAGPSDDLASSATIDVITGYQHESFRPPFAPPTSTRRTRRRALRDGYEQFMSYPGSATDCGRPSPDRIPSPTHERTPTRPSPDRIHLTHPGLLCRRHLQDQPPVRTTSRTSHKTTYADTPLFFAARIQSPPSCPLMQQDTSLPSASLAEAEVDQSRGQRAAEGVPTRRPFADASEVLLRRNNFIPRRLLAYDLDDGAP